MTASCVTLPDLPAITDIVGGRNTYPVYVLIAWPFLAGTETRAGFCPVAPLMRVQQRDDTALFAFGAEVWQDDSSANSPVAFQDASQPPSHAPEQPEDTPPLSLLLQFCYGMQMDGSGTSSRPPRSTAGSAAIDIGILNKPAIPRDEWNCLLTAENYSQNLSRYSSRLFRPPRCRVSSAL